MVESFSLRAAAILLKSPSATSPPLRRAPLPPPTAAGDAEDGDAGRNGEAEAEAVAAALADGIASIGDL